MITENSQKADKMGICAVLKDVLTVRERIVLRTVEKWGTDALGVCGEWRFTPTKYQK